MNNLLNIALQVIPRQTFDYLAFTGRTLNSIGMQEPSYAAAVSVIGSIQAVPRSLYEHMGLDLQKNYVWIYIPQSIQDIDRGSAGDQFSYNSQTWQAESKTAWAAMAGWDAVLCVEVPNVSTNYISPAGFVYVTEDGLSNYVTE